MTNISKSAKVVSMHFCASCNRFEILTLQMFDIEEVGQGHEVQFSQVLSFDCNYPSTKVITCIFALARSVSGILTFKIVYLQKLVKVTEYNFRSGPSMAIVKIHKSHHMNFALALTFSDIV